MDEENWVYFYIWLAIMLWSLPQDKLREEILLMDATVVESSAQNVNHSFLVSYVHNYRDNLFLI